MILFIYLLGVVLALLIGMELLVVHDTQGLVIISLISLSSWIGVLFYIIMMLISRFYD